MVTDYRYSCGEHSTTYKDAESQCYTPESNVTLCVNYPKKN